VVWLPNGTEAPGDFWSKLPREIVETAPLETLFNWFHSAEEKYHMAVPQDYPKLSENELKQWIYAKQDKEKVKEELVKQIEIEIPGVYQRFKTPYDLLDYLIKNYKFFIKNSDMISEEEILQRCLAFVSSDEYREQFVANVQQLEDEKEEYKRRARKVMLSGDRMRDNTEKALRGLIANNDPPKIFIRGGILVRIDFDEDGVPIITNLDVDGVRHVLERACDFFKAVPKVVKGSDGKNTTIFEDAPVSPPVDLVKDLMKLPTQDFLLPSINAVIESPTIMRDGELLSEKGYNKATRLYYAPKNGLFIDIKKEIAYSDVIDAVNLLNEIFIDFPFDSEASRANCLAALMTSVIRPMIKGNVPMVIIDKPVAGTGASLIGNIISIVSCGRMGNMMTPPADDEAWKKSITSLLLKGRAVNIIDNIEGRLYAPSLAAVITSSIWEDRILGVNKMVSLPSVSMWIGTGNNIQLAGDIPRRCYWVRMDPKQAKPWQRTGYKHENLEQWVEQNRGRILTAILTIAKAWVNAGCPPPKNVPLMGSFEDWRIVLGGIMEYCGISNFLGNIEAMYEQADTDTPQWDAFCSVWYEIYRGKPVVLNTVFQQLQREASAGYSDYSSEINLVDVLPDNLADAFNKRKSFVSLLGRALGRHNGRVFPSGIMIRKGEEKKHAVQWIIGPKPKDDSATQN
jgi:hypothetical protein